MTHERRDEGETGHQKWECDKAAQRRSDEFDRSDGSEGLPEHEEEMREK